MMAWYAIPNNGLMGRLARFVGMAERPPDEGDVDTVAVDGFHELRAYTDRDGTSYYDHDRCDPLGEAFVQRGGTDKGAIAEWRRMLREGEL